MPSCLIFHWPSRKTTKNCGRSIAVAPSCANGRAGSEGLLSGRIVEVTLTGARSLSGTARPAYRLPSRWRVWTGALSMSPARSHGAEEAPDLPASFVRLRHRDDAGALSELSGVHEHLAGPTIDVAALHHVAHEPHPLALFGRRHMQCAMD